MAEGWHNISIPDFLFNYGGGFLRRGLGGEIIFFFQENFHIPAVVFINTCCILSYICLAWIVIKLFLKRGYALNVLILGCTLGGILINHLITFRRDYLELLLLAVTLIMYRRTDLKKWIIGGNLIMAFALLLHESTFFFSVPALIIITRIRVESLFKSIVYWLPCILVFILCCIFSGSQDALSATLERAASYAPQAFENGDTPYLLRFIGQNSGEVFKMHFSWNFSEMDIIGSVKVPRAVFTLFYYIFIPYMTVAMLMAFTSKRMSSDKICGLVGIIVFQFTCLLPMFTVLSCDIARLAIYWMMSSLLIWLVLNESEYVNMFCHSYNKIIEKTTIKIFFLWLPGRFVLTLLALCIGITFTRPSLEGLFNSSIIYYFYFGIYRMLLPFI
ncbi:MAG: hypothetical protein K2I56_01230 [Muribaculaceae bacterium]|nr:hypothetical protein [Muribaculaceae bacterium]